MSNNLPEKQQTQKALTIRDYLFSDNIKNQLAVAVPKWLSVDRLLRITFTSIMKNPQLLDCTRESLLGTVMQCAQFGLEPVMNRAHLVPYWNSKKKVLECQFQPGYAGLADLGRRSGKISNITSHVVYENDEFDLEYGTEEYLHHKPYLNGDRGKPIGVYAVWFYKDGTKSPQFIPLQECYDKHRARSQSYISAIQKNHTNSPWITDESSMLKKTAIKVSSKLQALSIEFMQAIELDNQAELGRTQQGFFLDPSLSENQKGLELTAKDFDTTIPKETDQQQLNEFLKRCADQFNRSIDDVKVEAAENPEEFWKAFFDWQRQQKKAGPQQSEGEEHPATTQSKKEIQYEEKTIQHLIDSFKNLHKKGLLEFAEEHKSEILTWPDKVFEVWCDKFKRTVNEDYAEWTRKPLEERKKETKTQNLGTVVCPIDGEHKPIMFCENARGKDKPCEMYVSQECLARWPE